VSKPPVVASLSWKHKLVFDAASGGTSVVVDSEGREGPSPMQTLAFSVAGCMSMDVAYILTKGRHAFRTLRCELVAERASANPHRFTSVTIAFVVEGNIPDEAVARAIQLSHDTYCSVWHSLRRDIEFKTSFRVVP
jgi:putative redox protein